MIAPNNTLLEEMLNYREQKSDWIAKTLSHNPDKTMITFRINVPGEIKKNADVLKLFEFGFKEVKSEFLKEGISYEVREYPDQTPEWIAFFLVKGNAESLKRICLAVEEKSLVGRVYDLDVIEALKGSVSRSDLDLEPRKCYLCDCEAFVCMRNQSHAIEEVLTYLKSKADECF